MASQAQIINKAFQIKLNEGNKDKFTSLLKWCQENGLIDSFIEIANGSSKKEYSKESEDFLDGILEVGEREINEGKGYSSEEAKSKITEILKNKK